MEATAKPLVAVPHSGFRISPIVSAKFEKYGMKMLRRSRRSGVFLQAPTYRQCIQRVACVVSVAALCVAHAIGAMAEIPKQNTFVERAHDGPQIQGFVPANVSCGPYAVYAVARLKGNEIAYRTVVSHFSVTNYGVSMAEIEEVLNEVIGVRSISRHLSSPQLAREFRRFGVARIKPVDSSKRPRLAHWVLLLSVSPSAVTYILSPTQVVTQSMVDFREIWTGHVVMIEPKNRLGFGVPIVAGLIIFSLSLLTLGVRVVVNIKTRSLNRRGITVRTKGGFKIISRLPDSAVVFLMLSCGVCNSEAQDRNILESLTTLVDTYESHISSIAFRTTTVQEIVSHDPERPRVIADVTTNKVDVKVKNGKAIVAHMAYIGPDDTGELVGATTHAVDNDIHRTYSPRTNQGLVSEIDSGTVFDVFARDRVLSYMFLPPPGLDKPGLASILRSEGFVVDSDKEVLYGDEVVVCRRGETTLWIDAKHGGILRRIEERRAGRLRKYFEYPSLTKVGELYFPTTIKYTSFNRTLNDAEGEAIPYLICTIEVDPQSLRINDLDDAELVFEFPTGTAIHDKRTGVNYYAGGQLPISLLSDGLVEPASAEGNAGPSNGPLDAKEEIAKNFLPSYTAIIAEEDDASISTRPLFGNPLLFGLSVLGFLCSLGVVVFTFVYRRKVSEGTAS